MADRMLIEWADELDAAVTFLRSMGASVLEYRAYLRVERYGADRRAAIIGDNDLEFVDDATDELLDNDSEELVSYIAPLDEGPEGLDESTLALESEETSAPAEAADAPQAGQDQPQGLFTTVHTQSFFEQEAQKTVMMSGGADFSEAQETVLFTSPDTYDDEDEGILFEEVQPGEQAEDSDQAVFVEETSDESPSFLNYDEPADSTASVVSFDDSHSDADAYVSFEDDNSASDGLVSFGVPPSPTLDPYVQFEESPSTEIEEDQPTPLISFEEIPAPEPALEEEQPSYIEYEPQRQQSESLVIGLDEEDVTAGFVPSMADSNEAEGFISFNDDGDETTGISFQPDEDDSEEEPLISFEDDQNAFEDVGQDALDNIVGSNTPVETFDLLPELDHDDGDLIASDEDVSDPASEDEVIVSKGASSGPRVSAAAATPGRRGRRAPRAGVTAGLYGNPAVPMIRESQERPSAAAISVTAGASATPVLPAPGDPFADEEDDIIEVGDEGDYGEDAEEYDTEGGFSLSVQEYEYEEEEEEEAEEEEEQAYIPPEPEPAGPTEQELQAMLAKAQETLETGEMQTAIDLFSDILDEAPDYTPALIGRGKLHLDYGDYNRAMSDFVAAQDQSPEDPEPQVAMGNLYFARKNYDRAIDFFNTALNVSPNYAMAFCRRGISHYYRKNYQQALEDLNKAKSLDEDISNIRTYIAMVKKKLKSRR